MISLEIIFLLLFFLGTPLYLTIMNIIYLFKRLSSHEKVTDVMTMVLGTAFSCILFDGMPEWNKPLILGRDDSLITLHTPISYEYLPAFLAFLFLALVGYAILRIKKNKLPPIISVACISGILVGYALIIVWSIQIRTEEFMDLFYFILALAFPLNYILCTVRLLRDVISEHIENSKKNEVQYKNKILRFCYKCLTKTIGWFIFAFILIIPIVCILLAVLLLFGQAPDSIIKAFTSTSDWQFSQMVSPPPIEAEGHYLCTVAAGGSEKLVKPLRMGKRYGHKIIVNRQLCVANAFEDFIKEKTPRFHKLIRDFYDKHGYPLATKITTKARANVVYILMKPLEWAFLLFLYTFDVKPENRIAVQYTK